MVPHHSATYQEKKPRGNHFTKHLVGAFFYVKSENTRQSATWRNLRLRPIAVVATSEVPPTCVRLELVHSLNPSLVDKPWIKDRFVIFFDDAIFWSLLQLLLWQISSAVPLNKINVKRRIHDFAIACLKWRI